MRVFLRLVLFGALVWLVRTVVDSLRVPDPVILPPPTADEINAACAAGASLYLDRAGVIRVRPQSKWKARREIAKLTKQRRREDEHLNRLDRLGRARATTAPVVDQRADADVDPSTAVRSRLSLRGGGLPVSVAVVLLVAIIAAKVLFVMANPFVADGLVRTYIRQTAAKIAASASALGAGEIIADEKGNLYVGDGVTARKNLWPLARVLYLDRYPGVDATGATDSTTAVLAALAWAQTAGPNGSPVEVRLAPGSTLLLSQPIPLYDHFRFVGGSARAHLRPTAVIINTTTDVFTMPTGTTGTLSDVRINGFFFKGNPWGQNTSIITPQPVNGSGWIIDDLNFDGNAWWYFQTPLAASFLRLSMGPFNHNNCSAAMYLAGADSKIGFGQQHSFIDGILVGNTARWPAYSGAATYVQNNIVYVQDASNNKWFYRATGSAGTGHAPATGPVSNIYWTYIGAQFDATFDAAIANYNSASTYTTGTIVLLGAERYYATQAVPAGTAPPSGGAAGTQGPGTSGARTSNAYWQWCNRSLGTTVDTFPSFHLIFSMQQSELDCYPTACPNSGVQVTGTCSGSKVKARVNGYAPGRYDNSGAQLPGIDCEGILVNAVTSSSSFPSPSGTVEIDATITNASQNGYQSHIGALSIINAQHVRVPMLKAIWASWSGGPAITATKPIRIDQSNATTSDIHIGEVLLGTSQTVAAYISYGSGVVSSVVCDDLALTLTAGTNTIPIHCPPTYISGGTNSLPAASKVAPQVKAFVTNTTGAAITLGSAGGNINGAANISIPANSTIIARSDGTNWWAK